MITIDYLTHHQDCISALAKIWHDVLGKIWLPEVPIARVENNLSNHLNTEQLPLTFVAFKQNQPIGMCSLRVNDGIRPDLTPWLGSLVVSSQHQRQGVAKMLIEKTKEKARNMDFRSLYLFAFDPTIPNYYGHLGWNKIGLDEYKGLKVTVMKTIL